MTFSRFDQLANLIHEAECTRGGETVSLLEGIRCIQDLLKEIKKKANRVFVIGNGGSAGIASHHAVDLVNVTKLAATALVEPGLLSCMSNDYGYEHSFSRPLETLLRKDDGLIAVSSSGRSKNILNACEVARKKGARIISLSGFRVDNPLRQMGDINIWTGKEDYGLVETAHFFVLHTVVDTWELKA